MRRWIVFWLMVGFLVGCGSRANVEKERETLMRLDRERSASVKDIDKFMSYFAPDASVYPSGMPLAKGSGAIREFLTKMSSAPGFSLEFGPTKADVGASGDDGWDLPVVDEWHDGKRKIRDDLEEATRWSVESGGGHLQPRW